MRHLRNILIFLLATMVFSSAHAQDPAGWETFVLSSTLSPFELKMGPIGLGDDPDVAVIILWNDQGPNMNDLGAFIVPAPYDGTGQSFENFLDTGPTFSVSDVCTTPSSAVVAYIKNSSLRIARRLVSSWSLQAISQTLTDVYDSADCAISSAGLYVSAHNKTNSTIEIYRSVNDGVSFTLYTTITDASPIIGPSDGAIRDNLASDPDDADLGLWYQTLNGNLRLIVIDTSIVRRGPAKECTVGTGVPPTGFISLREGHGIRVGASYLWFGNFDGDATTFIVNPVSCAVASHNYGSSNGGSVRNYDGFAAVCSGANHVNQLWGDWYAVDPSVAFAAGENPVQIESPFEGTGGPTTAHTFYGRYSSNFAAVGIDSREPLGTVWGTRYNSPYVFGDSFESRDITVWRDNLCP